MNHYLAEARANLSAYDLECLARYRYKVFVDHLGWPLPLASRDKEVEWDEFDNEDTLYIIARDAEGRVCGCARLLPTTKPHLLSTVFPVLALRNPRTEPDVWELSRFATCQIVDDRAQPASPDSMRCLLTEVMRLCQKLEARLLVGVAPYGMFRLYRKLGYDLRPDGIPHTIDGEAICAFSLSVTSDLPTAPSRTSEPTRVGLAAA
ncbi:acyl-homoserine-lactone synthase [Burkholderia cenocepacia]|uniref:acyl-homoserine-lactone synthase n=1 Tax=Burkholderia cenocepacia TaxID=95486 RepID=UPI002AB7E2F9|nr:acyl-homoserine-lactone synthase [Burkholderia cenocepacia]